MSNDKAEIMIYCPGGPIMGWTTLAAAESLLSDWRTNAGTEHTIAIHYQSFSHPAMDVTLRLATISAIAMRPV